MTMVASIKKKHKYVSNSTKMCYECSSPSVEKWRAHINPTALQITWIAFCLVTPTTQTGHKKRGAASDAQCNN